jgi:DNA-binding transcriptional LysR family regulator
MRDLLGLRLFTRVARLGSISAAARDCGLSQSQASRIIADLETDLGVRLLSRTTRAVAPTDAGSNFLIRVEAILNAVEEAQDAVREDGELRGVVRISMPGTIGYRHVIPLLPAFLASHPQLRVQVTLEDRRQDLVRDAIDVSIRLGKLDDSGATAQRLASFPRVLLAARSYVDHAGAPSSPADLAHHRIIGGPSGTSGWTFERGDEKMTIDLQPYLTVNDNEGMVIAAIAGLGICPEVRDGSLVRLLTEWKRPDLDVQAYFPLGRGTRLAARNLVAYLKEKLNSPVLPD